jgi:hypothetical protein
MVTEPFLINKNILLISPEPWDFVFVTKHHYAIELAKRGNKVFFLNPPSNEHLKNIVVKPAPGINGVYVVDYKKYLRGQRHLPSFIRKWVDRSFIRRLERKTDTRINVILNFENSRFYDFDFLPRSVMKIYFQVDEDQNFHIKKAATTANFVFAINHEIHDTLKKYNKISHVIGHSFNGNFSSLSSQILAGKNIYTQVNQGNPKAYYVGNLDNIYLNKKLFIRLVLEYPNVDFVIIGPYLMKSEIYLSLKDTKNITFLGKIPSAEISTLLQDADILISLYINEFDSSSHKLLEYFASGKVIVSNWFKEHEDKQDLIIMSRKEDELLNLFGKVAENLEEYNRSDKMLKRISFAFNNTYEKNLNKIDKILSETVSY